MNYQFVRIKNIKVLVRIIFGPNVLFCSSPKIKIEILVLFHLN